MMVDVFQSRWQQHFGSESWWIWLLYVLEGPAHDCDDGGALRSGIEQLVFETAKNRGIETTQTCPRCQQVCDEATCFEDEDWAVCEDCRLIAAWRDAKEEERQRTAQLWAEARRLAYLQSLSPEERARVEQEEQREIRIMTAGLWRRDVQ